MEWISVKDRMPDVETEVLVLFERFGKHIAIAVYENGKINIDESKYDWDTDILDYDEENDTYIIPESWWESVKFSRDEYDGCEIDRSVTHWMPLPEVPEED